jgi:polysaccharide deacetylase 2 family uncharacterized protein YibQ
MSLWALAALALCAGIAGAEPVVGGARVALIIDDLGYLARDGDRVIALEGPVACAILPQTPHALRVAQRAHAAGKEVMLHLPLQPVEEFATTSAGTIQIDTTQSQLRRILAIYFASVPHVVGVNNHQGSLLTQHPGHMNWLMGELQSRGGLFFVDSFTSESSVALHFAREQGVPSIRRDVFLDTTPEPAAIEAEFRRLKRLARQLGIAVGIGHPYPATLAFLEQAIPSLRAEGIELVSVAEAIALSGRTITLTASADDWDGEG